MPIGDAHRLGGAGQLAVVMHRLEQPEQGRVELVARLVAEVPGRGNRDSLHRNKLSYFAMTAPMLALPSP